MPSHPYDEKAGHVSDAASRPALIGIDWGSTNLRSFLYDTSGAVLDERASDQGIGQIPRERLVDSFRQAHADWLEGGMLPILLAGMAGSIGGLKKTDYLPCPATLEDLAQALEPVQLARDMVAYIVPGLSGRAVDGGPDVMRGEEIQILGALGRSESPDSLFCLPGTHSKWVQVDLERRVTGFTTHMTGELFALLTQHGSLARWAQNGEEDSDAFDAALHHAQERSGLAHQLFGVRSRVLLEELAERSVRSYLSGILIGSEVAAMLAVLEPTSPVHLVGDPNLVRLYKRALQHAGHASQVSASAATAADGLYRIAELANLISS